MTSSPSGRCPASELAERYGTPLFVYDAAVFRTRIAEVRAAFGERTRIAFALKANPSVALARIARDEGLGVEAASAGELLVARAAEVPGGDVMVAGPGKSDEDLATALTVGARVHVESELEYERLARMAQTRGARPSVAIRVQPGRSAGGVRFRMAEASSRFGIDRVRVAALARRVVEGGACELVGLHLHAGSQITDVGAWLAGAAALLEIAAEVESAIGRELRSLDFGGGFGWPVVEGDPAFDIFRAGAELCDALERAGRTGGETWIEPGRYLVASAGDYLTRVVDVKEPGGSLHAILDGGLHHLAAAAGFGAPVRRAWPIVLEGDGVASRPMVPVTLGGPLCTPADRFGRNLRLPRPQPGDIVVVRGAGAYGLTFSPVRFLGHPSPAEVLVDGADACLIRRRGRPEDVLHDQVW